MNCTQHTQHYKLNKSPDKSSKSIWMCVILKVHFMGGKYQKINNKRTIGLIRIGTIPIRAKLSNTHTYLLPFWSAVPVCVFWIRGRLQVKIWPSYKVPLKVFSSHEKFESRINKSSWALETAWQNRSLAISSISINLSSIALLTIA